MKSKKTPTVVPLLVFTGALEPCAGLEPGREHPLVGAIRWDGRGDMVDQEKGN